MPDVRVTRNTIANVHRDRYGAGAGVTRDPSPVNDRHR